MLGHAPLGLFRPYYLRTFFCLPRLGRSGPLPASPDSCPAFFFLFAARRAFLMRSLTRICVLLNLLSEICAFFKSFCYLLESASIPRPMLRLLWVYFSPNSSTWETDFSCNSDILLFKVLNCSQTRSWSSGSLKLRGPEQGLRSHE